MFISQLAVRPSSGKGLNGPDEQSVTNSSRAGSPSCVRRAAPGSNRGDENSSLADAASFDSARLDAFFQSGSCPEEPTVCPDTGLADIPAIDLPSIAELGLPPCCANWAVTGQHALIMVQCTPEDAKHAFDVERASGRYCLATGFSQLAQALRWAHPNVPTHGLAYAALCRSAGSDCFALYKHVHAALTCGARAAKRRERDDATICTSLSMLAHVANQNATGGTIGQLGLLLAPTAKKACLTHHYGLTPSPTTMKTDKKEAELRSGHLTNQACFNARVQHTAMGSALDDYHAFEKQDHGSIHREFRVAVVRPLSGVSAVPLRRDPSHPADTVPGHFPITNGLNVNLEREQLEVIRAVIAQLLRALGSVFRLLQARPDFFLGHRQGDKVDLQQLRHRQALEMVEMASLVYDNVYDTAASSQSLRDVHLATVAEGALKSMTNYCDAMRKTTTDTPELKEYMEAYYLPITGDAPTYRALCGLRLHAASGKSENMRDLDYCKSLVPTPGLLHYRINMAKDLFNLPSYRPFWKRLYAKLYDKDLPETLPAARIYKLEQLVLTAWLAVADEGVACRTRHD